ncbi:MAG: hypothetical protein ACRDMH_01735 [Solirubrobacterales bacterium]
MRSIAALAAASVLAATGMWLAVGAGAKRDGGARAFAYPTPTYPYKMHIDGKPSKRTSSRKAKFRFHVTFNPSGHVPAATLRFLDYKCKLDGKRYRKCSSPKKYRHLSKGKHKFRVRAVFNTGNHANASAPAKYSWKIR